MNLKRLLPLLIVPLLLTACPSGANRTKNTPVTVHTRNDKTTE